MEPRGIVFAYDPRTQQRDTRPEASQVPDSVERKYRCRSCGREFSTLDHPTV